MTQALDFEERKLKAGLKRLGIVLNTESGASASRGATFSQWYRFDINRRRQGWLGHFDITSMFDDPDNPQIAVAGAFTTPEGKTVKVDHRVWRFARNDMLPVRDMLDHLEYFIKGSGVVS